MYIKNVLEKRKAIANRLADERGSIGIPPKGAGKALLKPVTNVVSKVVNKDGSILYKLTTKSGRTVEVLYDAVGFPVFKSEYDMVLDAADFLKTRPTHFNKAGKKLYEDAMKNPQLKSKFTEQELALFKKGQVPEKYTWHHHQDSGKMQLVDAETHAVASHTGGFSIWGSDK